MKTNNLITAGIIAGPFFIILAVLHALGREGFDMVRHPLSLLSLGGPGWLQISNFIITGLLFIACAAGLKRTNYTGTGIKWLPRFFILMGIGMIMGGVFVADPALGFPAGAPEGIPDNMSWHAAIHGVAPILSFIGQVGILIIMARRFFQRGEKSLMVITAIVTLIVFVLMSMPNITADWDQGIVNFIPMWIGACLGYFYISFVLIKMKTHVSISE